MKQPYLFKGVRGSLLGKSYSSYIDAEKAVARPVKLIRKKIADRAVNNIVRLVLTAILLVLVTACGSIGLLPTSELVQKAIALRLEQTQQKLSQQLDLDFQGFEIKRLSISQEQPLTIENLPAFRVRGTYDLILKLPKRRLTQPKQPFDVYLQIQQEGKTWRSLIPEKGSKNTQQIWRSYLVE